MSHLPPYDPANCADEERAQVLRDLRLPATVKVKTKSGIDVTLAATYDEAAKRIGQGEVALTPAATQALHEVSKVFPGSRLEQVRLLDDGANKNSGGEGARGDVG